MSWLRRRPRDLLAEQRRSLGTPPPAPPPPPPLHGGSKPPGSDFGPEDFEMPPPFAEMSWSLTVGKDSHVEASMRDGPPGGRGEPRVRSFSGTPGELARASLRRMFRR